MPRDYTPSVAREVSPLLEPGEIVLKAVMGNPEGSLLGELNKGRASMRAAVEAMKAVREAEHATGLASTIPRRNAYVTITDRRLVFLGSTRLGRVDELLAGFGFGEIRDISAQRTGFTRRSSLLTVEFRDRTSVTYLIIQNQDSEGLIEAFRTAR
jgi:hypothetical protein